MWLPTLTVGSPGTLGLPVRLLFPPCGCESARVLPSLLGPSPSGVCEFFLAFVPLLEAMSESLTHSFPRSFLVVALYASAVGFADALWLCPERALRRLFASGFLVRSRRIVAPLAPCLSRRFPSLVRVSLMRRGFSLGVGSVGALGELRWLHLYRLTPDLYGLLLFAGCLGCSGQCFLFTVRHSARIHGDHLVSFTDSCVSLARRPRMGLFLGHLHSV